MSISAVAANISPVIQSVLEMRKKLDDLQRQLGTGMKADTYSGLGPHIGLAVGLHWALVVPVTSNRRATATIAR